MNIPPLSLLEARVLGVLIEKQRTVPDTYPLSLNALTAGCNQKTSRDPLMNVSESDVQGAIDRLKLLSLAVESSGGRVMRYAHNTERVLAIPVQAVALLAALMLRGPQTAGELRINSDRLHRFADISAVEAFLHEAAARSERPLVLELPRQAGARETRWVQLLSGMPDESLLVPAPPSSRAAADEGELQMLRQELESLRAEIDELKHAVAGLRAAQSHDAHD